MKDLEMYTEIAKMGDEKTILGMLKNFEIGSHISPLTNEEERIVLVLKNGLNKN